MHFKRTFTNKLRVQLSEKIHRMPMKYFERRTHGEVLSRLTNDIDTVIISGMGGRNMIGIFKKHEEYLKNIKTIIDKTFDKTFSFVNSCCLLDCQIK